MAEERASPEPREPQCLSEHFGRPGNIDVMTPDADLPASSPGRVAQQQPGLVCGFLPPFPHMPGTSRGSEKHSSLTDTEGVR